MDEKKLYLLLDVLYRNRTSKILIRNGMSYRQISEYTSYALKHGYLKNTGSKIVVTKKGLEHLDNWEESYKIRNKELWIDKEVDSKIEKIDLNFIYLPKRWETDF